MGGKLQQLLAKVKGNSQSGNAVLIDEEDFYYKSEKENRRTPPLHPKRRGKPFIFGWGSYLSHNERLRIKKIAAWSTIGVFVAILIGIVAVYWITIAIVLPGKELTSVNGHSITQGEYRQLVIFKTQLEQNALTGPHGYNAQVASLNTRIASQQSTITTTDTAITHLQQQLVGADAAQTATLQQEITTDQQKVQLAQTIHDSLQNQLNILQQTTIPQAQQLFNQSQVTNDSAEWLQDDEIIREWIQSQSPRIQQQISPSTNDVNAAVKSFISDLPNGITYTSFLTQNNLGDNDVHTDMALKLRRDRMQTYLASIIVSPAYQVRARTMTLSTPAQAQSNLQQLQHGANFGTLAGKDSVDANTSGTGGELGWLVQGQYAEKEQSGVVDDWLFYPRRKVDDISPVLTENGAYHIVQIEEIAANRPVDSTTLSDLQNNALSNWIFEQKALPTMHISAIDQNMLQDPANIPSNLPSGTSSSGSSSATTP